MVFLTGKGNDNKLQNKNRNFSFIKEKDLLVNIIDVSLVITHMLSLKHSGWGVVISLAAVSLGFHLY